MTKPNLLSAALICAGLLTTPAMAQQDQPTSQRLIANALVTTSHGTNGQTRFRNRASDLRGLAERDVWGHWGTYYGPMVPTVP